MRAAIADNSKTPLIGIFDDPRPVDGFAVVDVRAAALTNLDIAVAQGRHYLSPKERPFVIGREAVAIDDAGRRCFYPTNSLAPPFGSMAERTLARIGVGLPVPDSTPDDLAAALGNAGLAAWLPLAWRAQLARGETVLILGATGVSGLIAVAAARLLGAGRIVAAGRDPEALRKATTLGADATIDLNVLDNLSSRILDATNGGADVVIDYLNGSPAEAALEAMRIGGRMVQIGSPLSPGITLGAANARMRSIAVLGFAYYHATLEDQSEAYRRLCEHAVAGDINVSTTRYDLADFEQAWNLQLKGSRSRVIVIP